MTTDFLLVLLVAVAIPEVAFWWVERENGQLHEANLRRLERMKP